MPGAKEITMSVMVIADFQFHPDAAAEAIAGLHGVLPDARAFDGCIGARLLVRQDDHSRAVLVEEWGSRATNTRRT
jgi:quinol monooxygenase YgiN